MSQTMFQAPALAPTLPHWLSQAGLRTVRPRSALFTDRRAMLAGVVSGVTLNAAALLLHGGAMFAALLAAELALAAARSLFRQADAGRLVGGAAWCALQGVALAAATLSGEPGLQILAAMLAMGQLGVICSGGATTPRLTLLLAALCNLPFLAAAACTHDVAPLVLLLQAPLWCMAAVAWMRGGLTHTRAGDAIGLEIA